MWNLISISFETVLVSVQDRCSVYVKRTIASKSFQTHPMVLQGDEGLVELCLVRLEIVLILTQDRCTVCNERTIGSLIVLDAPDGTRK
jgi:hypothetical protein